MKPTLAEMAQAEKNAIDLKMRARRLAVHLGLSFGAEDILPWDQEWLVVIPMLTKIMERIEQLEKRLPPAETDPEGD